MIRAPTERRSRIRFNIKYNIGPSQWTCAILVALIYINKIKVYDKRFAELTWVSIWLPFFVLFFPGRFLMFQSFWFRKEANSGCSVRDIIASRYHNEMLFTLWERNFVYIRKFFERLTWLNNSLIILRASWCFTSKMSIARFWLFW